MSYYGVGPPPSDVDVAVLYSKPTVTDMVTDLLWPVHLSVLCHPNIAARHAGKSLSEFIESNELLHVRISDLPRHHLWTQFARQANLGAVHVERGLVFDNVMLAVQYALSGEGLYLRSWNGETLPMQDAEPGMLQTHAATTSLFAWLAVYAPPS